MAPFNTQRNKFASIYNWSQTNTDNIVKKKDIQSFNQKALFQAQKSLTTVSINRNFSTDWILLDLSGSVGKDIYNSFELTILNIPENFINSIKTDILFKSLDGIKTIENTAIYRTIQFEIEDLINPEIGSIPDPDYSIKNLKITCSLRMTGSDILEGLYVKFLCYLYPVNEIVK